MTDTVTFRQDIEALIDNSGGPGTLKCGGTNTYNPATGETTQAGAAISVMFAVVSTYTMVDLEPNRRAIQRDTGLDKLAEGRILFYLREGELNKPSETGHITNPEGTVFTFSDLRPYIIQNSVVAYEALHRGVRDGL